MALKNRSVAVAITGIIIAVVLLSGPASAFSVLNWTVPGKDPRVVQSNVEIFIDVGKELSEEMQTISLIVENENGSKREAKLRNCTPAGRYKGYGTGKEMRCKFYYLPTAAGVHSGTLIINGVEVDSNPELFTVRQTLQKGVVYNATPTLDIEFSSVPEGDYFLDAGETSGTPANSEAFLAAGKYYNVNSNLAAASFKANMTFSYPDADNDGIVDGTEINENTLGVYYWNGGSWSMDGLSIIARDTAANTMTIETNHFTLFAPMVSKPLTLPQDKVIVLSDEKSLVNLVGGTEFDLPTKRDLAIRWKLPKGNYEQMHVFVGERSIGVGKFSEYAYLGRAANTAISLLLWSKNNTSVAKEFRNGPEFGKEYRFKVIGIGEDGNKTVINSQGSVKYLSYGTIPENTVIVTDNINTFQDLVGGYDVDPAEQRELAIRWNLPGEFEQIHIQVGERDSGTSAFSAYKFLGRPKNIADNFYTWSESSRFVGTSFKQGPQFGKDYRFRVVGIKEDGKMAIIHTFGYTQYLETEPAAKTSSKLVVTESTTQNCEQIGSMSYCQTQ